MKDMVVQLHAYFHGSFPERKKGGSFQRFHFHFLCVYIEKVTDNSKSPIILGILQIMARPIRSFSENAVPSFFSLP
ncbi:Uncharacterised protein [Mycobacteroides abscessus subsp. abscessus]|nr:Uncharacterised protein [Mycobacteroides abscessus subsp. abscessus]